MKTDRSDAARTREAFRADVVSGLTRPNKSLPCKWFYDAAGSRLFERITTLDAYYPTRTEVGLLTRHADAMADAMAGPLTDPLAGPPAGAHPGGPVGEALTLIEYGSGSAAKTPLLLDAWRRRPGPSPLTYIPVEISDAALAGSVAMLRERYPGLTIRPLRADYTRPLSLDGLTTGRRVAFFPGGTIGNFTPDAAADFLRTVRETVGTGGAMLLGVDLKKSPRTLLAAYDDPQGVTAAFNRNLLGRIADELSDDFDGPAPDPAAFDHHVLYRPGLPDHPDVGRIEMHLVSRVSQRFTLSGRAIAFHAGEGIHTEDSDKYAPEGVARLAAHAGWTVADRWVDDHTPFGLFHLRPA